MDCERAICDSRDRSDLAALCAVSFLSSMSYGQMFVVWPYLALALGASATQVGLIGAVFQGTYALAVLAGRRRLDRMDVRFQAMVACLTLMVVALAMTTATRTVDGPRVIPVLFALVAVFGLCTSWLWPPVMGWVSRAHEGQALNRRLGWFNVAWSSGLIVGPYVGGRLYEISPAWAFVGGAACHATSFVLLACCRPPREHAATDSTHARSGAPAELATVTAEPPAECAPGPAPGEHRASLDRRFRPPARVGLIGAYLVFGLLAFQLPNLATELGLGAGSFGEVRTTMSLTMAAGFVLLGRSAGWHYRFKTFLGVQVALGMILLLAATARGAAGLHLCAGLSGAGISFLYASHLYYGVSGGRNRARLMSVHEMLLSAGMLIGAYGGGVIADLWQDNRAPYLAGCIVILALACLECVLARARPSPP